VEILKNGFNLIFIDECSINRIKPFRKAWMKRDDISQTHPIRERNLSLLAAMDLNGQVLVHYQDEAYNETSYSLFLKKINEVWGDNTRHSVLFADNASIHKSVDVLGLTDSINLRTLFNAPYSPHLNPIEFAFNEMKRSLRNDQILTR
jgi:hypothetical protein